jgi:hypothetical protein
MFGFRLSLLILWSAVSAITVGAIAAMGIDAAPATFVRDLAHPWRAQFYADLEAHLLLFAGWIVWRERASAPGFVYAAATLLLGALFTLPYLLVASAGCGGGVGPLLLGSRAGERGPGTA